MDHPTPRRAVLAAGVKLAYSVPVVAASLNVGKARSQGLISGNEVVCDPEGWGGRAPFNHYILAADTMEPIYPGFVSSYFPETQSPSDETGFVAGCFYGGDFANINGSSGGRGCFCYFRIDCEFTILPSGQPAYLVPCN